PPSAVLRMELAVKAQPLLVSSMRIAVSGTAGFEETGLADGVMDGVLVLLCGELVGTAGAWDDDMEPAVLHAPSSARASMSTRGSHATCVGFLHIFLSPIPSSSFFQDHPFVRLARRRSDHDADQAVHLVRSIQARSGAALETSEQTEARR